MVRVSERFLQQITLLAKDGYGTVDASMARIINAADPIDSNDLATKDYVDSLDAFTVNSINDLRSLTGSNHSFTQIKYHTTNSDGGGGIFDRYPVGSYVDNDGTIIVAGPNAWIRRGFEVGPVRAEWWGILDDGVTNWSTAIQRAIVQTPANGTLLLPHGTYIVRGLVVDHPVNILGENTQLKLDGYVIGTDPIMLVTSSNVSLEGILFNGDRYNQTGSHGDHILLHRQHAAISTGDVACNDTYISKCVFENHYNAAVCHIGDRLKVTECTFRDTNTAPLITGYHSIDNSVYNDGVLISSCLFIRTGYRTGPSDTREFGNNLPATTGDAILLRAANAIVVNNTILETDRCSIKIELPRNNITIQGNTHSNTYAGDSTFSAIGVQGVAPDFTPSEINLNNILIANEIVKRPTGLFGATLCHLFGVSIRNCEANILSGTNLNGIIALDTASHVSISNCNLTSTIAIPGLKSDSVALARSDYYVTSNYIKVAGLFGVYVGGNLSKFRLRGNTILSSANGIYGDDGYFDDFIISDNEMMDVRFVTGSASTRTNFLIERNLFSSYVESSFASVVCRENLTKTTASGRSLISILSTGVGAYYTTGESGELAILPVNDTTPSVKGRTTFTTANTNPTLITNFDDGVVGKPITIIFQDSNTTLVNGSNIHLTGGANFVSSNLATITLALVYAVGWVELSRDQKTLVTTIADLRALTFNPKLVQVTRYAAAGTEAGGGQFEYISGDSTTLDDGGIWFVNAVGGRYRRSNSTSGRVYAAWYGIFGDNTTDQTTAINTLLNSRNPGDVVIFEKGRHRITGTIDIGVRGITIIGQGVLDPNPYIDSGTIFSGTFNLVSGTTATIDSVINNPPDIDASIVTLSGLTGLGSVLPGDTIHVSNAALERNDGYFTIMSVYPGDGYVTYLSYNQFVHTVDYQWKPTPTGETNNGSLHWEIRKSMFRIHNETSFENVFFNGANTVGTLVDSGYKGTNGTPGVGPYDGCTGNRFKRVKFRSAYQGLKIGDFSTYASGGCNQVTWANSCDLHYLDDVTFTDCNHSGFCIPNSSGTSVLHNLDYVSITECGIGIAIRKGSFKAKDLNFAANINVDILIQGVSNTSIIQGGHSEGSPRFLIVGAYGYFASTGTVIPLLIESYRADQNVALPADNCYIQSGALGGLIFKSCNFESTLGSANWTIGVQGRATNGTNDQHAKAIWLTFEGCTFPIADRTKIVTAMAGSVGLNPSWYYSLGSCTIAPGSYLPIRIIDGVHASYNSPTTPSLSPSTQFLQINIPSLSTSSLLVDGYNDAVTNPYRTSVTVTGPTDDVILNGITAGEPGQSLTLRLKYNQLTEVSHLSTSASAGRRIITQDTNTLALPAPGASPAYNLLTLEYDTSEDSGNGAWVVKNWSTAPLIEGRIATGSDVSLPAATLTAVLPWTLTGLDPSASYVMTLGTRTVLWKTSNPDGYSGSMDETVDLYVTTDGYSVATATILSGQVPDLSRLPATLLGATCSITTSAGGITLNATAPAGIACTGRGRMWISNFERIV